MGKLKESLHPLGIEPIRLGRTAFGLVIDPWRNGLEQQLDKVPVAPFVGIQSAEPLRWRELRSRPFLKGSS